MSAPEAVNADPLGLAALETEALAAVADAANDSRLDELRVAYLGRKSGRITKAMRGLGELAPEQRAVAGRVANRVKTAVAEALAAKARDLSGLDHREGGKDRPHSAPDLTLPSRRPWRGQLHPVTRTVREICDIFRDLGFVRARGPEADNEWYNFEALNTPLDHPAADEQDTLYLEGSHLLRSHTSSVQMRTLEAYAPPVRILAPGWVYRRDSYDATHTPAFMQVEGLVVDEGITFVDFKATLAEFARRYWGPGFRFRFRPAYFPFTEPSAELDVKRVRTDKAGHRRETDWLEVLGAGMVDPAVIENAGLDSERYTGFAFGIGSARVAMLKYGVDDLRSFFESDVRFLQALSPSGLR